MGFASMALVNRRDYLLPIFPRAKGDRAQQKIVAKLGLPIYRLNGQVLVDPEEADLHLKALAESGGVPMRRSRKKRDSAVPHPVVRRRRVVRQDPATGRIIGVAAASKDE
jgi:hypothetical protein